MNTDIHQLIVFLCGVERLQIAKERRSDKRRGQRGIETLLPGHCPGRDGEARFPGWRCRHASFPRGAGSTQPPVSSDWVCDGWGEPGAQGQLCHLLPARSLSLSCSETFRCSSLAGPGQSIFKCSTCTSRTSTTFELLRNANSTSELLNQKLRMEPSHLSFSELSGVVLDAC